MKRLALLGFALVALSCASPAAPPAPVPAPPRPQSAPTPPVAELEARTPELELLMAQRLEHEGKLEEAYQAYVRALDGDAQNASLLKHLAELAFRLDKQAEAREFAERAVASKSDDAWLPLFLGESYRADGDVARMESVLTSATGEPLSSDAAAVLYQAWLQSGELEKAGSVARWQTEVEPDVPAGWLNLAEISEQRGDAAGAEKILREADLRIPGALDFLAALANSRRGRGDRLGELGVLSELLARAPKDAASWLAKAEAEFDLGREEDGRRSLARAEELQPGDLRTSMRIALLDLQRGAFADAERRLASAAELYPEQYEIAYFLGVARRRLGDSEGALAAFDRIAEEHARFADGRVQVAGVLEAAGDHEAARIEVERAQRADNSRALTYYHASLLAKGGDLAGGIAELESMLRGEAEDAEALYNIGVLRGEAREAQAAIAAMERVLALEPNHAGALNFIGYSWAERGERLDEAQSLIERALAQRPEDGFITDSLGWVLFMRARAASDSREAARWLDQARAQLERAEQLTGGDPVISEHLGDVYAALGKKRTALQKYEQAVAQTPRAGEQPELQQKLERLRRELAPR